MKVYLQYWEESERGWGTRPDGCSLHTNLESHIRYIDEIYRERTFHQHVPHEYDKVVSGPIQVEINESLFQQLSDSKSQTLRLSEVETQNLIKLNDINL